MNETSIYDLIAKVIQCISCEVAEFTGTKCDDMDNCAECLEHSAKNVAEKVRSLTFERPLFEDGQPVQIGDETESGVVSSILVYLGEDEIKSTIYHENNAYITVRCGERLKRKQIDTQDRIDEDALKHISDYWKCGSVKCRECPSKIDGKTPMEYYGVDTFIHAKTLDLLRRQRELDARTMGGCE